MEAAGNYPAILHVSTASYWRGGEQQTAYLLTELNKRNIPQLLLCPHHSALHRFCEDHQLPYRTVRKRPLLDYYSWPAAIARICKKEGTGIIHAHESNAHSFAVLAADRFHCKAKMIVSRRVVFPLRKKKFTYYKYNHPLLRSIICDAEAVRAVLLPHIKDPRTLTVIPPAVDIKKFEAAAGGFSLRTAFHLPENTRIAGTVSALTEEKDVFTFIDIAALFLQNYPDIPVVFFIFGDGKLAASLKAYAQEKGLASSVIFTGFRKDITRILPQLDVLLLTSLAESINSSLLDAMACRVPVICTKAGGNAEVVKHEETGMLANLKDVRQLAENLLRLLTDDALRDKIVRNAYALIQHFSVEETGDKILHEYLSVCF